MEGFRLRVEAMKCIGKQTCSWKLMGGGALKISQV